MDYLKPRASNAAFDYVAFVIDKWGVGNLSDWHSGKGPVFSESGLKGG